MRPLISPSPLNLSTNHRPVMTSDSFAMEDSSSRSSSLPPHSRVAFSGVNTLAPCSKEFQKSLNDLTRNDEENNVFAQGKLTLPVIQVLRNSETSKVGRDANHQKLRLSCWDDDDSGTSCTTSEDEISTSWTSLSSVGTLVTLEPNKRQGRNSKSRSEKSDVDTCDDSISVRSDSYMMCKQSPSLRRKLRGSAKVGNPDDKEGRDTKRLSRKDADTRGRSRLEPPTSKTRQRGLSPLSRPQQDNDCSFRQPIYRSKSAHTSPQQERRDISKGNIVVGTNSAPSSPYGSPLLSRAHHGNARRATEIPKWKKPFNLFTTSSGSSSTNQSLNPILKLDTKGAKGRHPRSYVSLRGNQDVFRLSDLSVKSCRKEDQSVLNLEDEFKRLSACRYLRSHSDEVESDYDDLSV